MSISIQKSQIKRQDEFSSEIGKYGKIHEFFQ